MPERVMGLGQQKSLKKILENAENEFLKYEGAPRKISGRSGRVAIVAERDEFEGEFQRFEVRVQSDKKMREKLVGALDHYNGQIDRSEADGWQIFRTPPQGSADYTTSREAVETIMKTVGLPEVWRFEPDDFANDTVSVELLFRALIQYKASDIHLSPGQKPIFRIDNKARVSDLLGPLSAPQILALIQDLSPKRDWEQFLEKQQNSFSFHQKGIGYARASAFMRMGAPHLTFRYHSEFIPTFEELNMPPDLMTKLAQTQNGLVIISGMTGSGKSSTCASLLDWVNRNQYRHILTLEDPVEFHHKNKKCFVNQRNLGTDFRTFAEGMEGALRHDPDVILIGELRDGDTIRTAISAASTGHLVLSSLHANDASGVTNRITSFFDPVERELVRQQLTDCLRCIICQKLIVRKGGGRVPALEMLFNDVKPITKCIAAGDTLGIRIGMQQTLSASVLFEHYLYKMYKDGIIELETAREAAQEVSLFDQIQMGTYSVPRMRGD
jgi:twitching motility protein PilT